MSISSHCLPVGTLGTNEIPVCNVSSDNVVTLMPSGGMGVGNVRGVVVGMHGLSVAIQPIPPVAIIGNSTISGYASAGADFDANLLADGWIVITVPYPEDFSAGNGALAIWNDINSDTGNGSRYLANQMHWWDHVVEYIHTTYDPNIPIVAFGGSWGGYHALAVAINRQSTIIAYCSLLPATILSNTSPVYTNPANYGPNQVVSGYTWSTPLSGGTAGMDIGANALLAGQTSTIGVTNPSGVTIPGIILYGTNDGAVGWQSTASLPGVNPISSTIDQMLTNSASAGLPILRDQTNNAHAFTNDDAGYSATYINTGPTTLTSINSSGKLDIKNTGGNAPLNNAVLSGKCGIFASDNQWHTITFTNFAFVNYTSTAVANVTSLSGATITLGSTADLNRSSGYINIATSGTTLLASFSSVVGNTLHGVTYVSGSGAIAATSSGYMGNSLVTLVNYCSTPITNVTTISGATLTISSTLGLCSTGGVLSINTNKLYITSPIQVIVSYTGVSGSTITGVNYVSGGVFLGNGNIVGDATSAVTLITPLIGVTIASPGSATVSGGAPVCTYGIAVPGGFMNMSYPAWFTQYVDTIAPRKY